MTVFTYKYEFKVKYAIGDKVTIDGDTEIKAVVVGICIYAYGCIYEVSWFTDGVVETEKFDEFRLEKA